MLVQGGAIQALLGPIDHRSGLGHRLGQGDPLRHLEGAEIDRHGKGGGLAFRYAAIGDTANELTDFVGCEGVTVPFLSDDLLRQEGGSA